MKRILFVDKKRDYRRYFENSPEGLAQCAQFLFKRYCLPWNRHHRRDSTGLEWFMTTRAAKLGIDFLNLDADFFKYKVSLVDLEEGFYDKTFSDPRDSLCRVDYYILRSDSINSILYQDLNPKAKIKSKTFPNTPEGLQYLGELILEVHYRPWFKLNHQGAPTGFEIFFFTMIQKDGLNFLKNDESFFKYRLTLVDSEMEIEQ